MSIVEFRNVTKKFGSLVVLDGIDLAIDSGEVNLKDYRLSQWRLMHIGAQPVPPVQVRSAARPLMAFLASLDPTRDKPARMAEAIHSARGGDEVSLTVTPCPNGFDCRLLVEEGILEMLGKTDRTSEDGF